MKVFTSLLLLIAFTTTSCDKSSPEIEEGGMPVTNAIRTGNWMVIYYENNTSMDVGLTFLKFNNTGTLVATKDGTAFNGTWTETNAGGNNMFTINITTTDAKLQKVNKTWKVTGISEYYIDMKDMNAPGNSRLQLMMH